MCELVLSVQEFLKIVPGIVLFPLSFYLTWKKLGTKVIASITLGSDRITASRITYVDLSNLKDRPIAIYSMHAVVNNMVTYEIDKFEPPVILKPLESLRVETKPFSSLWLDGNKYELDIVKNNDIAVHLVISNGIIKCMTGSHPCFLPIRKFANYKIANKVVKQYNNIVYGDNVVYAIIYMQQSQTKTAFVDTSGLISREWGFGFNIIPQSSMLSKDHVKKKLEEARFDLFVDFFDIQDLRNTY